MPLVQCTDCLGQVSDRAFDCPHCGAQLRDRPRSKNRGCLIVILAILILGGFFVWRSLHSDEAAPPTAGVAGAIRPSQELLNSSYELDESEYLFQSFELYTDARVHLEVYASPEPVDVMLMTPSDFEGYRKASEEGGSYTYRDALSGKQILRFDKTEILAEGEWTIVIRRPIENILSPQSTTADITLTIY